MTGPDDTRGGSRPATAGDPVDPEAHYAELLQADVAVLEAWVIVVAVFVFAFNLLADVLYSVLDPRIRLS